MDIVANRRKKLQHVIDTQFGRSQAKFIEKTGINQGELSGLLKEKSFGEKKARNLELQAELPNGYLDTPIGSDDPDPTKTELLSIYTKLDAPQRAFLLEQAKLTFQLTQAESKGEHHSSTPDTAK